MRTRCFIALLLAGPLLSALAPARAVAASSVPALRLMVSQPGIQHLTGASLAAAGWQLSALAPANVQVWCQDAELPLELIGAGDGRIDPDDELRFYAPSTGDRWNRTETCWLEAGPTPGLRMGGPATLPPGAAPVTVGQERGRWYAPARYNSRFAGPDQDHWFSADMRTGPDADPAEILVPLSTQRPAVTGAVTLTIHATAFTSGPHVLEVQLGAAQHAFVWAGVGDWSGQAVLDDPAGTLRLTLQPGPAASGVLLDSVEWARPVTLAFAGQGGAFEPPPGGGTLQLSGLPPDPALYDITEATQPARVALGGDQRVAAPAGARYLLAGPGTLHTPAIGAPRADLAAPLNASAVYIAPGELHAALAPLLAARRSQGYQVAVVDVQAIYDTWSNGQVAPEAIRSFLRHARDTWALPPQAVILVGDGSIDPHDYSQRGPKNVNLIPPYAAAFDPWLGEIACDTCYAQLDGASVSTDTLPDVWIGRLPVKSAAELAALVQKMLAFEAASAGPWQARAVLVADDRDGGGDFATLAEQGVASLPASTLVERVYYDPLGRPGSVTNATRARTAVLAAFGRGAAVVSYVGHANEWQWAFTDAQAPQPYLLGLYDADLPANGARLPVVLSMTCLSTAFQTPAASGTTVDERLVLNPGGGAIAVWGSSGNGVAYGHDMLQRGFFQALAAAGPAGLPLGAAVGTGLGELHANGCCPSALRSAILLGDPLTRIRLLPGIQIALPRVAR